MDSVTQAVLGAGVAAAVAPKGYRRKALVLGAALGTLPDLDVLIDYGDAVRNFTYHRGFSHSLLVLGPLSVLLWWTLKLCWAPVREAPQRWLAAIALALLTHPLLDAHTAYGTQLLWPLDMPPTMWSTIFIIDPLFTLPLFVGVSAIAFRPEARRSSAVLSLGVALCTAYLGWTWLAKSLVERNARDTLARMEMTDARVFSTPTPFNSLLWRVVVVTGDGFFEGLDSLVVDDGSLTFEFYPANRQLLQDANDIWAVRRLRWFARDFVSARVEDDRLVLSDLRMGQNPVYVFSHVVAVRSNPHWEEIAPQLLPVSFEDRAISEVWARMWSR